MRPGAKVTKSVGLILRADMTLYSQSPFFGHVQHGLHDVLAEHGVCLVFLGTEKIHFAFSSFGTVS